MLLFVLLKLLRCFSCKLLDLHSILDYGHKNIETINNIFKKSTVHSKNVNLCLQYTLMLYFGIIIYIYIYI